MSDINIIPLLEDTGTNRLFASIVPPFKRLRKDFVGLTQQYEDLLRLKNKLEQLAKKTKNELQVIQAALTQEQELKHQVSIVLKETKADLSATEDSLAKAIEVSKILEIKLDESKNQLSKLDDLKSRYELVTKAISAPRNPSLIYQNFNRVLNDDLFPFMNKVNVLLNEAEVVLKLKAIEDRVRLAESMSHFKNKTIIAVSGGFSSGKSSFISSLFSDSGIQLPVGIEPITAIPTYVFNSEESKIIGYTKNAGEVSIQPEIYNQLSHKYVNQLGFNLKDLLPFIAIETPLSKYPHISFIDLPGYNPGDRIGFTKHDKDSATEFMTQAQCVLWVIGLDSNGTVPREDIEFLSDAISDDMKLYVVINKADLRPLSGLEEVLDEVEETLQNEGVSFHGISAYSSEFREEFSFRGVSINQILSNWNTPRDTQKTIIDEINGIFSDYDNAFEREINYYNENLAYIKALELDLYELGAFEEEVDLLPNNIKSFRKKYRAKNLGVTERPAGSIGLLLKNMMSDSESKEPKSTTSTDYNKSEPDNSHYDKVSLVYQNLSNIRKAYNSSKLNNQRGEMQLIHLKLIDALQESNS